MPEQRKVNWVWYWNAGKANDEYREIMTDKHGFSHHWTLPLENKMAPVVWGWQRQRAVDLLPPQFAEVVAKTASLFAQAITDLLPPRWQDLGSRWRGGPGGRLRIGFPTSYGGI